MRLPGKFIRTASFALVCLNDRTKNHGHQAPAMIIITSGYEECDNQENSCLAVLMKLNIYLSYGSVIPHYFPKIDVNTSSLRNLCLYIDRNFINEHINYKHLRCSPVPHIKQTRIELNQNHEWISKASCLRDEAKMRRLQVL